MKKTKVVLDQKLLLSKVSIVPLTVAEKNQMIGGATITPHCPTAKTCPNSCVLTLCNTPETTACPPTN